MEGEKIDEVAIASMKLSEIELSNEEDFVKIEKIKDPDNLLVASRDDTYEQATKKRLFCGPGSVAVAVFNLCSVALGPSSLSLPYAFSLTGLALATLVSIFAFICTVITSNMIIKVRLLTMTRSFEEAIKSICGKWGIVLYNIFMFCILYGACVAYLIGVGDLMYPIYHNTELHIVWWLNRKAMMIIFFVLLVLPLSWKDNSNSLAFTSMLSFVGCFVFTFLLIVWCFYDDFATHIQEVSIWKVNGRFIESTSIILFSFIFQMNIYEIHSELTIPTEDAMKRVDFLSALSCCIIYVLTGIAGYIAYPHTVEGNIISTWTVPSKPIIMSILVAIAYVGMAFTVIFSFPLNVLPLRYTIQLIAFGQKDNVDSKLQRKIYICNKISTLVICISSLLIALFFEQIEIVFNLIGGLPSGFIGYALPSYCILVLYYRHYSGISKFYLISAGIILVLGLVIGVYSFINSIVSFFS